MTENLLEAQYDITKKSKLRIFYDKYKFFLYFLLIILILFFSYFSLYLENKKNKRVLLSDDYLQAKVFLDNGEKVNATNLLNEIALSNDSTYSTLSFFLLINQNLIVDKKDISNLFDHIISKNKFSDEDKNLLIYKKALFSSTYLNESELLDEVKPLLNSNTSWKAHGHLLLGDYFTSKNENLKAIEFYQQVFNIKNLNQDLYSYARFQLSLISNE